MSQIVKRMISFPPHLCSLPGGLRAWNWHSPYLSPSQLIGEALQAWFMRTLTHSPTEYYSNQTPHYWKPASSGCLDRVITGYYTDHLHGHLQVISITLSYLQAHFLPHNICLIRLLCGLCCLQMESEVTTGSKVSRIWTHPQCRGPTWSLMTVLEPDFQTPGDFGDGKGFGWKGTNLWVRSRLYVLGMLVHNFNTKEAEAGRSPLILRPVWST